MSWVKSIGFSEAEGKLKKLYLRFTGSSGKVDNVLQVHSLRPHTLEGHMVLYKNTLHHSSNQLGKDLLEAIGVYVSLLNQCEYCVTHHYASYQKLVDDQQKATQMLSALKDGKPEEIFSQEQASLFQYAKKLTCSPVQVTEMDLDKMRSSGYDDGEILEVNQVVGYFNYANRTVLGLGVELE